MGKWLFLLFTVVPVLEVFLLVQLGALLGPWPTIGIVVATGLIGAALARDEGARVVRDWQQAMLEGRLPRDGVLSGLLVLVGGVLLVTPGVLTDIVGFALLVPITRRPIAAFVRKRVEAKLAQRVAGGQVIVETFSAMSADEPIGDRPGRSHAREPDTIDM